MSCSVTRLGQTLCQLLHRDALMFVSNTHTLVICIRKNPICSSVCVASIVLRLAEARAAPSSVDSVASTQCPPNSLRRLFHHI